MDPEVPIEKKEDPVEEMPEELMPVEEVQEPPKPPKPPKRWPKKTLRWVVLVLAIFALGVEVTWLVRVRPTAQENRSLQAELGTAQARLDELESVATELSDMQAENQQLASELEVAEQHLALLRFLAEVDAAQLALIQGSTSGARQALDRAETRLIALANALGEAGAEETANLQERLTLAQNELDEDAFAAQNDLEVLRNSVLGLEGELFGE